VIRPEYAEALSNRGNILQDLRGHDEAPASYEMALAVRPVYAKALLIALRCCALPYDVHTTPSDALTARSPVGPL